MAAALARGWGEPVLCTDCGSGPGGGAGRTSSAARRSPPTASWPSAPTSLILAHKPAPARARWPRRSATPRGIVVSILGGAHAVAERARPRTRTRTVFRVEPNTPVERAPGRARSSRARRRRRRERRARRCFARARDGRRGAGAADAASPARSPASAPPTGRCRRGLDRRGGAPRHARRAQAATLVTETMAGTAALLRTTTATRSRCGARSPRPGGSTARGLAALERGGVRAALAERDGRRGGRLMEARQQIADFLSALFRVYTLIIFAWIVVSLVFSLGVRVPVLARRSTRCWTSCATSRTRSCGSSAGSALQFGPLDFSPIVAIIVLQIGGRHHRRPDRGP